MDWSDADTERARVAFYEKGLSASQVGKMIGRSRCAVSGRMWRLFGRLPATRSAARRGWNIIPTKEPWEARQKGERRLKPKSRTMTPQIQTARPERSLRLTELETRHCRWIVGYDEAGEALFCAGERTDDPMCWYCGFHRKMAWVKRG